MAVYEFPASLSQRWMWLVAEMDPGMPTYNIPWALWLDGPLDVSALQRAWDAALVRHEALRTIFRNESGVPVQVIEDEPAVPPLRITSVAGLAPGQREQAALDQVRELARIPFDLATGPLARASLVELSPEAHVLAVVMHHVVADGWSVRILFDELSADYAAISRGGDLVATEPPIQYADFAIWQIEHAENGGYAAAERFWLAELADAPPALPLPADSPYPARPTFAAERIEFSLDTGLADALRKLAASQGTTLFTVLLAGYAAVLARLTGSNDLLIAVPMAARTRPETESVVGLFMNTIPIRIRIDQDGTLGDLVRAVHAATTRALAHEELPFARVVELVRPDRDPARLPLVQVMFTMDESWAVPDRGGLRWRPKPVDHETTKFEMELTVTDTPAGPQVRVNYNKDLFRAATGQLVADGFAAMLSHLRDSPDLVVGDADIMSPDTLALVTTVWPDGGPLAGEGAPAGGSGESSPLAGTAGGSGGSSPLARTALAQLWGACAGDSVVAVGADGALTGADARDLARRITAAVRGHGVGIGDRVAILLPRGARLLSAILGIWSSGASYVPLDPIYPAQRLATMLGDAGVAAIVVDSGFEGAPGLPPGAPAAMAVVDLATLADAGARPTEPVLDLPSSAAAVTIFTSGSTGRPKAVSVTHGGIAALLSAVRPLLALGPRDRLVAVTTLSFDIALVELLAPVLAGGCVEIVDAEQALDAARLRDLLTDSGATAMQATPAGWRMLVDAGGVPDGVKLRMSCGEPLPRDLADAIGAGTGVRLWNFYGPTETTIYSGGDAVRSSPAPIEIASIIAGTQLYVLDARLRPVPPGVFGEVCIGGAGVAHGYRGAPGMTAGRFVPDPFSGRPGARLYRTGDVGRWRGPGRIELAGRADRQIKIRGYRVESGEVEAALRGQDDIAQAVVSLRGADHDVRLVGYIVTRSGAGRPPAGLHERLREVLPDYMVPSAFVVLPALPLTGSGKIDYRALPEPDWGVVAGQVTVAPRTPAEARLAAIVAELIGLREPPGVYDNFFAIGGHSLTATRLMARIRASYGVDLPIRTLFADPTVAALAAAVIAAGGEEDSGPPRQSQRAAGDRG